MDCDGPKHALIVDSDGRFTGSYPERGSVAPFAELRYASNLIGCYHNNKPQQTNYCIIRLGIGQEYLDYNNIFTFPSPPGLMTTAIGCRRAGWGTRSLGREPPQRRCWSTRAWPEGSHRELWEEEEEGGGRREMCAVVVMLV